MRIILLLLRALLVGNIMAKLGFNSRTQIAAWIAEKPQGPGRTDGPAQPV